MDIAKFTFNAGIDMIAGKTDDRANKAGHFTMIVVDVQRGSKLAFASPQKLGLRPLANGAKEISRGNNPIQI